MLDWVDILRTVNDYQKCHKQPTFDNLVDMFNTVYHKLDWSTVKICKALGGVSWLSISNKMKELGIQLKPHGGRRFVRDLHPEKFGFCSERLLLKYFREEKLTYLQLVEIFKSAGVEVTSTTIAKRAREYGIRGTLTGAKSWEEVWKAIEEKRYLANEQKTEENKKSTG